MKVCATCGKTGDDLKQCAACKLVNYYGRECQAIPSQARKSVSCVRAEIADEILSKGSIEADKEQDAAEALSAATNTMVNVDLDWSPPPRPDCPSCVPDATAAPIAKDAIYMNCCGKQINLRSMPASARKPAPLSTEVVPLPAFMSGKGAAPCSMCRMPQARNDAETVATVTADLSIFYSPRQDIR